MPRPWVWAALAMAIAALDLRGHLFFGWVPHDEGALALAASLVRDGQWPHRDFADVYSGGLALFDAGAQVVWGDSLHALRIPFALAAILWVGLLAACFRRFTYPAAAAGLALLAFLWGPPLYTSPMPSWYLLFLATAVIWCLLRWQETGRAIWCGAVGLLVGLALLIKINALILLAGAGCVLISDAGPPLERTDIRAEDRPAAALLALVPVLGAAGAALAVVRVWGLGLAAELVLPLSALAVVGSVRSYLDAAPWRTRMRTLARPLGYLAGGVALIVGPWILAYWTTGSGRQLFEGVVLLPLLRSEFARIPPPPPGVVGYALALLLGVLVAVRWSHRAAELCGLALVLIFAWVVWRGDAGDEGVIQFVWGTLRVWAVTGLLIAAAIWARRGSRMPRGLIAVGWVTAWFALIQFPFAAPIYFAYGAPLFLLTAAGVFAALQAPRVIGLALALGLGAFTMTVNHGQTLNTLGFANQRRIYYDVLDMPRGGLIVPGKAAEDYRAMLELLDRWGAERIVAGPDAPEVYYLSGRPFPDREFYEFMAPGWSAALLAQRVVGHRAQAAVLDMHPGFSHVSIDSVVALLPAPPVEDTIIGRFRLLRLQASHASP